MASGPASHVKPVTKQTFGRASPGAAREAAPEALPNGAYIKMGVFGLRNHLILDESICHESTS